MKSNNTGGFLGTVEDRIKAYKKYKSSNINQDKAKFPKIGENF